MSKSEKPTTHVSFVCQKCSQPIKLNKTLQVPPPPFLALPTVPWLLHEPPTLRPGLCHTLLSFLRHVSS